MKNFSKIKKLRAKVSCLCPLETSKRILLIGEQTEPVAHNYSFLTLPHPALRSFPRALSSFTVEAATGWWRRDGHWITVVIWYLKKKKINLFTLAVLGLLCCASSSLVVKSRSDSRVAVHLLLSLQWLLFWWSTGSRHTDFSSCSMRAH